MTEQHEREHPLSTEEEILDWYKTASNMEKLIFYRSAQKLAVKYEEDITSLLRHGSFMDYKGRCEQYLHCRLCGKKWLWENDEPSEHKETCLYLLRANILEGKDERAT